MFIDCGAAFRRRFPFPYKWGGGNFADSGSLKESPLVMA
jgi:hypothetical protein